MGITRHCQLCREELRRAVALVGSPQEPGMPDHPQSQLQPRAGTAGTPTLHPGVPQPLGAGQEPWNLGQHLSTPQGCRDSRLYSSSSRRHQMGLGGRGGRSISILLGNSRISVKKQARIWQRAEGGDACQGLDSCTFFTSKLCDQQGCAESQEELPELPHRICLILPLGDTLKKQTHPRSSASVSTARAGLTPQDWTLVLVFPPSFPQFRIRGEGTGEEETYPRLFFHFALPAPPMHGWTFLTA